MPEESDAASALALPATLAVLSEPSVEPGRFRRAMVIAMQILVMLGGAGLVAACIRYFLGPDHHKTDWLLTLLMALASLAAGCWSAMRRWRDYTLPMRTFQALLPGVRLGEVPIEELSSVKGGISPIVPMVQQLLRDLREERKRVSLLEEETRQRVMTRTESLERKIGSLRQQATRDSLTGLNNRRHLDQQLPEAIDLCLAKFTDLTVLMIDVDYFKILNDTLGHAAGDELLRQIAQLIRSSIRETDSAFRCGGDEFVIMMPGATEEIGRELAARLRSLVDSLGKTIKVSRPPRLSIGVASLFLSNTRTATDLLAAADKALYDIKASRPVPSRVA